MSYVYSGDTPVSSARVGGGSHGVKLQAFHHDEAGNLSGISTFDPAGAALVSTMCFVHDALGRLTTIGRAKLVATLGQRACSTDADVSAVEVRFRYDAWNRRVARQDGNGPWKHWVATVDGEPIEELQRPTSGGGSWTVLRNHVWLEGRPIAQVEYPGPAGGNEGWVYAVHTDHLGQPRALSSAAGLTVWTLSAQRPYGEVTEVVVADPASGREVVSNLRLPGQYDERLSQFSGMQGPYYNWHRWYLPSMGRYMELDPVALAGEFNGEFGPSWYAYVEGNPLSRIDPTGLYWLKDLSDFSAAFGSTLSFGLTDWINEQTGASAVVNRCSGWYTGGKWSGVGLSLAFGAVHMGRHAANVGLRQFFFDPRKYKTVQRVWSKSVGGYDGKYELHHWIVPQRSGELSIGLNLLPISEWLNGIMTGRGWKAHVVESIFRGTVAGIYGAPATAALKGCPCR